MSKPVFSLVFALPLFAASAVFAAAEVEENLPDYAKESGVSGTISSVGVIVTTRIRVDASLLFSMIATVVT